MRIRVFVSGPLSSSGDREETVRKAAALGVELARRGYAPFIPHLTHYADPTDSLGKEAWYETGLAILVNMDALIRIPGESVGADREVATADRLGIPVVGTLNELDALGLRRGHVGFHELLPRLGRLHDRKQTDYGKEGDPFANVRGAEDWNVQPWVGAMLRANDKIRRLQRYAQRRWLANEKAADDMLDIAVYSLIAYLLHEEQESDPGPSKAIASREGQ